MPRLTRMLIPALGLALAAPLHGAQAVWVTGKVVAPAAADGSGTDAPKHSSLSLIRANVPGELAVQLGGPDATDPMRIFAPAHKPAYYLADAGSQWPSGISTGQTLIAIVETMAPDHGWRGAAYAGAVDAMAGKAQLVSGLIAMPDLWLSPIPQPSLAAASPSHIALSISAYASLGAPLSALSLWRRPAGLSLWEWQASLPNPSSSSSVVWDDLNVMPENLYEYALSLDFTWPGGGGAGALSMTAGIYSTKAHSVAGPFAASLVQPSPTPSPRGPTPVLTPVELPDGWLAYPNPAHGEALSILFDAKEEGRYEILAYTLSGGLALRRQGSIEKAGRNRSELPIKGLASGVYLLRINIEAKDGKRQEMPLRKIAILK
jgi:hypothetical protein